MARKSLAFLLLAPAFAVAWAPQGTFGQDAKTVLANVSKAMGADKVTTVQYSGTATEFAFGQAVNPNSPWPGFAMTHRSSTVGNPA